MMTTRTGPSRHYEHLSVWERVRLKVSARDREDEVEARRLDDAAPDGGAPLPPHLLAEMALNTFALMYVAEQLEHVAAHFFAMMKVRDGDLKDEDALLDLAAMAGVNAFCVQTKAAGWELFCRGVGVDPDALVAGNHHGIMLGLCADQMGRFVPDEAALRAWFRSKGLEPGPLITPESECRSWHRLLERSTSCAPCTDLARIP